MKTDRGMWVLVVVCGLLSLLLSASCYFAVGYLVYKGAQAASPYLQAADKQLRNKLEMPTPEEK